MSKVATEIASLIAKTIGDLEAEDLIELAEEHPLTSHTFSCNVCQAFSQLSEDEPELNLAWYMGTELAASSNASPELFEMLIRQVLEQDERLKTEELVWAIGNNFVADASVLQTCFELSLLDEKLISAIYSHPNCSDATLAAIEDEIDPEFLPEKSGRS